MFYGRASRMMDGKLRLFLMLTIIEAVLLTVATAQQPVGIDVLSRS